LRPPAFLRLAFLPFRRATDVRGRSRGSELIGFLLLWVTLEFAVSAAALLVFGTEEKMVPIAILRAALAVPAVGLGIRRLHDSGLSGWCLLLAIPAFSTGHWGALLPKAAPSWLAAGIPYDFLRDCALQLPRAALLALLVRSGEDGLNRYGPDPRDASAIQSQSA
jgi:uncharacterized membrane protein YhaH (DUF805 family)